MKAGELVFDVVLPGSSREAIALFSGATEDPNPIHVDDAFAQHCGFAQVIQQGPMTTAQLARLLAESVGRARLKSIDVSFTAPVFPLEPLRLTATVGEPGTADTLLIELLARKTDGTVTARGSAEVEAAR